MSWGEAASVALALAGIVGLLFSAASWLVAAKLMQQLTGQRDHWQQLAEAAERRAAQVQLQSANLHADLRAYRMASEEYEVVADAVTRGISELNRAMTLLVEADDLLKQARRQDEGGDDDA